MYVYTTIKWVIYLSGNKEKKPWHQRWWAITLFIIIGLSIVGNLFGNDNSNNQNNTNTQNVPVVQETKIYSVGDELKAGDFNWKITGFSKTEIIGEYLYDNLLGEKADGIFLIIDVEITNNGNSAKYLSDSFIKLIDEQNREFSATSSAAIYLKPQGSALIFEQINPGITKKGKVVFDVPKTIKVANIKITSNLLTSNNYNVKLEI